jgi:hypothetical protein
MHPPFYHPLGVARVCYARQITGQKGDANGGTDLAGVRQIELGDDVLERIPHRGRQDREQN